MRLCAPIVLPVITLLSFYTSFCLAIFADEAYQTDYHHSLLGFPQAHTTFFHRPSAASKASLLYTLSERCVLGAVNPKDGSVVWRHPLSDLVQNITAPGLLAAGEGATTLVSAVDSKVQVWDATDGRLVWEWESDGGTKALEISAASDGKDGVLILSDGETSSSVVRKLAADTGDLLWEFTDGRYVFYLQLTGSSGAVAANGLKWRCTL